ncbi:PLP-dependent aminotransferase family protein [Achromobacter sp. UMC71]|uniref:MocR-like pyridoxine biosynthesis transcription factor PdxR n=1 Tax=Achromobacter sp. UMC71 TaxID=1862320 RepID=UPI0016002A80|nr:PLP-dependent aminotransferase family protein [Achromobacter sp. UMC71]MBB1627530.1 aminotransferase [Achromobacter sp. UMC71]
MTSQAVTWLVLDRPQGDLEGQLCRAIRERVQAGRLAAGERLPSTRALALSLRIARSTVVQAYERLRAEGYLETVRGSGTRISTARPRKLAGMARTRASAKPGEPTAASVHAPLASAPRALPFQPGVPDLKSFPAAAWARCVAGRIKSLRIHDLGYGPVAGLPELRAAILAHASVARGVVAQVDQVAVFPSAAAAIDTLARVTLAPHADTAWIEDPGWPRARDLLRRAGARLVPVPCDADGIDPSGQTSTAPRLIYVTPSHQCPTGVSMSLPRRLALLDVARRHGAFIIEDDYDSEFRYDTQPIAALQGIDSGQRVAYVGTFSKTLAPGLRVAYAILPPELAAACHADMALRQGDVPVHIQAGLADFLNDGHFRGHIRRMRGVYAERMDNLLRALTRHCGDFLDISDGAGGLKLAVRFRDHGVDDRRVAQALAQRGYGARTFSEFCLVAPVPGLVFGIAQGTPARSEALAVALAAIVRAAP